MPLQTEPMEPMRWTGRTMLTPNTSVIGNRLPATGLDGIRVSREERTPKRGIRPVSWLS
jgi:hypothetical protein